MKRSLILWLTLTAAAALTGCGGKQETPARAEAAGPTVAVQLAEVKQSQWPSYYDAVGTVRARISGQVSGRVMAYVREVRVHVGDRVAQGQTLIVLDARDLSSRQRQAEAGRAEARSAALEADQGIESARTNLELTETTFKRMKDLHDKTSISNQEFDEASARLRMARSALDMAQSRRKQVDAKIAQADEEAKGAEIQVGYSTIAAPFSGVVTEKTVEAGNLAVPGAPLLTIEQAGGLRLEASVEEANLAKVRLGQRVAVWFDSLDHAIDGTVSEIVPAVDPGSRAFIAKIDLPGAASVRSGMFGRARFIVGERNTIAVPDTAVVERGQMQWVFVPDNGRARARILTLGQRSEHEVEALSGVKLGEHVIVSPPADLADGARVEARP